MRSGSFESFRSANNFERLSKKQNNNQATDQSGTVDFFSRNEGRSAKLAVMLASVVFNLQAKPPDDAIKLFV